MAEFADILIWLGAIGVLFGIAKNISGQAKKEPHRRVYRWGSGITNNWRSLDSRIGAFANAVPIGIRPPDLMRQNNHPKTVQRISHSRP